MATLPLLLALLPLAHSSERVIAPPYVSLGETYEGASATLMWHTEKGSPGQLVVDGHPASASADIVTRVAMPGKSPYYIHRAVIHSVSPGARIRYSLGYGSRSYEGSFVIPKSDRQPFSFLAVGDIGRGTLGQKKLAVRLAGEKADFVTLLGDIAYPHGTASDYRTYFFPIQNSDVSAANRGAPLLRNILTVPVLGNHDNSFRNLSRYPDGLAYYVNWSSPVNGPVMPLKIKGSPAAIEALRKAALGNLSRIGNYSFSYGNSRWVVLDSGSHVNWGDPELRRWLSTELAKSQRATWSFVAMHAPPYHSSRTHAEDIGMRAIAELFTRYRVDLLFTGHIHNYQRSYPMTFMNKQYTIDRNFDGKSATKADGTICIISGGGGAELYDVAQSDNPSTWQPFTATLKSVHSFTRVDVRGRELILRQIDKEGRTIDQIRLTK